MFLETFSIIMSLLAALATEVNGISECAPSCETCHEHLSTYCRTCAKGYYDPSRYRARYSCARCPSTCLTCDLPDYNIRCLECINGRYGKSCGSYCSDGCTHRKCGLLTGNCTCKEYYAGESCDACVHGRYGKDCLKICNNGCLNDTCSKESGECVCKDGFTGLNCTQCVTGKYGQSCELECGKGCSNGDCNRQTGQCVCTGNFNGEKCDRCVAGKYDLQSNCSRICPENCLSCVSKNVCEVCKPGFFGTSCTQTSQ